MDEVAGSLDGRFGVGEVFGGGEPFVTEGEDFGAKGGGDEVWYVPLVHMLELWAMDEGKITYLCIVT